VLGHQLGQDLVLGPDSLLQVSDPLLVGGVVRPGFWLEGGRAVLEELLLPAVEDRGLQAQFIKSFEIGAFSNRCRLRMATFSAGE
jgi:hypothetical protein